MCVHAHATPMWYSNATVVVVVVVFVSWLYVCLSGNANGNILASTSLSLSLCPCPSLSLPLPRPYFTHHVALTVTRHYFFLLFAKTFCAKFNCNENFHPLTVRTCESSLTIAVGPGEGGRKRRGGRSIESGISHSVCAEERWRH